MSQRGKYLFSLHPRFARDYDHLLVHLYDRQQRSGVRVWLEYQRNVGSTDWYAGSLHVESSNLQEPLRLLRALERDLDGKGTYSGQRTVEQLVSKNWGYGGYDHLRSTYVLTADLPVLGSRSYRDAHANVAHVNGFTGPKGPDMDEEQMTRLAQQAVENAMRAECRAETIAAWVGAGKPVRWIETQKTFPRAWPEVLAARDYGAIEEQCV